MKEKRLVRLANGKNERSRIMVIINNSLKAGDQTNNGK